jgi:hypothetical protein
MTSIMRMTTGLDKKAGATAIFDSTNQPAEG